jgi:hypothetical protein
MKTILGALVTISLSAGMTPAKFGFLSDPSQALSRASSVEQPLSRVGDDEFKEALPRSRHNDSGLALPLAITPPDAILALP